MTDSDEKVHHFRSNEQGVYGSDAEVNLASQSDDYISDRCMASDQGGLVHGQQDALLS